MSARNPRLVYWYAKDGWRWFLQAPNFRTIAESGEAYTTLAGARKGFLTVRRALNASSAWLEVEVRGWDDPDTRLMIESAERLRREQRSFRRARKAAEAEVESWKTS